MSLGADRDTKIQRCDYDCGFYVSSRERSANWQLELLLPTVADRMDLLQISPIRRVSALLAEARESRNIISFGGGAPSVLPAQEVIDEMIRTLKEQPKSAFSYVGTRGLLQLRQLLSKDFAGEEGTKYDPQDEVVITDGATEGIFCVFMSILGKGDELILTDPTYLGFGEAARLAGDVCFYFRSPLRKVTSLTSRGSRT